MKVYCFYCKHYFRYDDRDACESTNNSYRVGDWNKEIKVVEIKPEKLNRYNNCGWYEKKN